MSRGKRCLEKVHRRRVSFDFASLPPPPILPLLLCWSLLGLSRWDSNHGSRGKRDMVKRLKQCIDSICITLNHRRGPSCGNEGQEEVEKRKEKLLSILSHRLGIHSIDDTPLYFYASTQLQSRSGHCCDLFSAQSKVFLVLTRGKEGSVGTRCRHCAKKQ